MKNLAILSFLIFLSSNALAAPLNVTYNQSVSMGGNSKWIQCTNSTIDNQIYCFSFYENAGSPSWQNRFYRYNATLNNATYCNFPASEAGYHTYGAMDVVNESYIWQISGGAYCDLYNISNITYGGTCARIQHILYTNANCSNLQETLGVTIGRTSRGDTIGGSVYGVFSGAVNKDTLAKTLNTSQWATVYDWGYGALHLNQISAPNKNDNTTVIVSSSGFYSANGTASPFLQYVNGNLQSITDSPQMLYGVGIGNIYGRIFSDFITNGEGNTLLYMFDAEQNRMYMANWSEALNYSQSCNGNLSMPIGTICDSTDSTHKIYGTYDGCNITYTSCPSGSICSQLTPQINVSSGLVENYTSCQIRTNGGLVINCFNICFNDFVIFSNCVEDACKVCPDGTGRTTYGGIPGYYTDTWYSNQSSVSVPSYTIACINTTSGKALTIIDQNGNSTTEEDLLEQSGNNITRGTPPIPTPTPSTDNSVASFGAWINSMLNTPYGSEIIAFIVSMAIGIFIFLKTNSGKTEAFIIPFLAVLCGFCLPGVEFFPTWIWLLLTIFTGVLIFWKARGG